MTVDLSDVYDAAYSAEVDFLRAAVDGAVCQILVQHVLDRYGMVGPQPSLADVPEDGARTARGLRTKLLDYGIDRGDLVIGPDGRLRARSPGIDRPPLNVADLPPHRATLMRLVDALVRITPRVLEGTDGFAALEAELGLKAMFDLWEYLMVDFPPKRPCNILLARVLIEALRHARSPAVVFEGGAGVGTVLRYALAASELPGLLEKLERYIFTDISAVLLDKGKRWLSLNAPDSLFRRITFERVDLDCLSDLVTPYNREASLDLILLEHVLYDLRDLDASLRHYHRLLKPGGRLAFTMSFRGRPARFFSCEILQSTFHSYTRAKLDPPRRTNVGYLTLDEWKLSLESAGFAHWEAVPAAPDQDRWPFGGIVATRAE